MFWYWTTFCQSGKIERWGWWQTEGDRQPGCLSLTFPGWAEDSASGDAMHGAVPGKETYARHGGGNKHIHRHTLLHTHTDTHLLYTSLLLNRGHEPRICKCTHAQTDNSTLHRHTCTQGFHWTPSYKPNTCTNTHIHNLCKWAPEAPWHVADAQFSCPHPVSRLNQSSPLHTGQQHGRRWKITMIKESF